MGKIYLDRNENQYGPAPACFAVLRSAGQELLSRYARTYLRGVKSELSERLSHELGIPEQSILLSYGSEDMLKQVVHCYLKPGETILLPDHSWWYYKSVASEVSGVSVTYPLEEGADRFAYDVTRMVSLAEAHQAKVILIASPGNPTGNSISSKDLATCARHNPSSVVVLDEAYHGFSDAPHAQIREMLEEHPRLVILRTFSKYYALAGLRIGYACAGSDLSRLAQYSARYLGYNQLTEKVALAALDSTDYYIRTSRAIREDNERYFEYFRTLSGFRPFRTEANFILVRYPRERREQLKSGLEERGVFVKFLDDPGLDDCVRITTGTTDQNAFVLDAFREVFRNFTAPARTSGPS